MTGCGRDPSEERATLAPAALPTGSIAVQAWLDNPCPAHPPSVWLLPRAWESHLGL